MIRVVALDASRVAAWAELFEASASTCYCRYWHFEGNKNDWLARASQAPEKNREEQAALVVGGDAAARGLLALARGPSSAEPHASAAAWTERAVGWMKLTPRASVPKLRRLPVYRALAMGDDEGVYSVGCFLVRPGERRIGVARALLAAADTHVASWGGRAIEAYPRRATAPLHDEEAWMGPASMFARAGYVPVHPDGPYPVLRKTL